MCMLGGGGGREKDGEDAKVCVLNAGVQSFCAP